MSMLGGLRKAVRKVCKRLNEKVLNIYRQAREKKQKKKPFYETYAPKSRFGDYFYAGLICASLLSGVLSFGILPAALAIAGVSGGLWAYTKKDEEKKRREYFMPISKKTSEPIKYEKNKYESLEELFKHIDLKIQKDLGEAVKIAKNNELIKNISEKAGLPLSYAREQLYLFLHSRYKEKEQVFREKKKELDVYKSKVNMLVERKRCVEEEIKATQKTIDEYVKERNKIIKKESEINKHLEELDGYKHYLFGAYEKSVRELEKRKSHIKACGYNLLYNSNYKKLEKNKEKIGEKYKGVRELIKIGKEKIDEIDKKLIDVDKKHKSLEDLKKNLINSSNQLTKLIEEYNKRIDELRNLFKNVIEFRNYLMELYSEVCSYHLTIKNY